MTGIELLWHRYRYYPYERELARREVSTLLTDDFAESEHGILLRGELDTTQARRLVYLAGISNHGRVTPTVQAQLEQVNGNGVNRQSTRYSAHGLHEYKGKFNPQIARALLNILNVPIGARVLDPFCGSGTSLLECAHLGMEAIGTDLNPFAVFIANAKLKAMRTPVAQIRGELITVLRRCKTSRAPAHTASDQERRDYLLSWFDRKVFDIVERLRSAIDQSGASQTLLAVASNLLRDYSKQDPNDLRIRRRKTPLPDTPFLDAFEKGVHDFLDKLGESQSVLGQVPRRCRALLLDSRELTAKQLGEGTFDCAITSPPYATALPYIDTQRLSLVWLGLISPREILPLEAKLVGSREVRGRTKMALLSDLMGNKANLPKTQLKYCMGLQKSLSESDGFRRQAVPLLLYRYFVEMAKVFRAVRSVTKKGSPFALIVGHNHTVLGGKRFDIDTPQHLAQIGRVCGWRHAETLPLQTYQRYGLHAGNAVSGEALVVMRAE